MSRKHEIKIAYIGGGSRGWAQMLMADLALSPDLTGELALYDIDRAAARRNEKIAEAVFSHPQARTRFRTRAVPSAAAALKNADFVVLSIEPGPTTMRYADLVIPARHGIIPPVGDSTGPGGIVRALRAIPVYADYARQIMSVCPRAWVINYTNPMTLCTAALYAAEPRIKAFGCCHEVFGIQWKLAGLVEKWFGVPRPARHEIELDIAGVNHFTLATAAAWRGRDLMPRLKEMIRARGFFADRTAAARDRMRREDWFTSDGLIAYDFLARFGVMGAAGDRHLSEFVPWYLRSEKDLNRWGVICTTYEYRLRRQRMRPKFDATKGLHPSGEEGVRQMTALLGQERFVTNVNLPNRGQIRDLPDGAVVETYAEFMRDAVRPVVARPLPPAANMLVRRVTDVQAMTLRAALTRDRDLAFQALLNDPLVCIRTDRAWKMFGEMLAHVKRELPGWRV